MIWGGRGFDGVAYADYFDLRRLGLVEREGRVLFEALGDSSSYIAFFIRKNNVLLTLEGFIKNMFWFKVRFPRKMALLAPWLKAAKQSVSFIKLASSKMTVSKIRGLFSRACCRREKVPVTRIFAAVIRA